MPTHNAVMIVFQGVVVASVLDGVGVGVMLGAIVGIVVGVGMADGIGLGPTVPGTRDTVSKAFVEPSIPFGKK